MAICPFAEWRPLPENRTQPALNPRTIIDHSIVGSAEGAYGYFLNSTSLESHFIVKKDGSIIQLIDTNRTADANYQANSHAVSIETEDNGNPNTDPWTPAQLKSLHRLHMWLAETHGIPRLKCASSSGGGLGYHSMFGAPSAWTPSAGKTCPGTIRIRQWNEVLLPAFVGGKAVDAEEGVFMRIRKGDKGDPVAFWQARANRAVAKVDRITVDGDYGPATAKLFQKALGTKQPVEVLRPIAMNRVLDAVLLRQLSKLTAGHSRVNTEELAAEVAELLTVEVSVKP